MIKQSKHFDRSQWLSFTEAAEELGVSPVSVRRSVKSGKIKAASMPFGSRAYTLINRKDLHEYVRTKAIVDNNRILHG